MSLECSASNILLFGGGGGGVGPVGLCWLGSPPGSPILSWGLPPPQFLPGMRTLHQRHFLHPSSSQPDRFLGASPKVRLCLPSLPCPLSLVSRPGKRDSSLLLPISLKPRVFGTQSHYDHVLYSCTCTVPSGAPGCCFGVQGVLPMLVHMREEANLPSLNASPAALSGPAEVTQRSQAASPPHTSFSPSHKAGIAEWVKLKNASRSRA